MVKHGKGIDEEGEPVEEKYGDEEGEYGDWGRGIWGRGSVMFEFMTSVQVCNHVSMFP